MTFRSASPEDAPGIASITNAIIRDTLITFTTAERGEDDIAAQIRACGDAFVVAEEDGQIIGFATFGPFRPGPGYRHTSEHSIQLLPAARGKGVGRALMTRLEQVAKRQGVHVLVAGISGANPEGIAFHTAIGFETVGTMPQVGCKSGQWLDLVLMQKILTEIATV